jgi:NuA3 HAT complex component NTO1
VPSATTMASTSPKATRTATQTPVRGRGRGRPRLYARGTSSAARRKIQQASAPKSTDNSPTNRRRPTYQNGYRPGGAGGGGRYIHPSTGEEIPAYVYKEIVKSGEKGDAGSSARRTAPPPPPPPPTIGPDGVYKPREERSYVEFHPGFDIEQPLLALTAQEVDGENYKPPVLPEAKTVRVLDIKEEEELRKEMSGFPTRDGSQSGASIRGSVQPEGSSQHRNTREEYTPGLGKRGSESAASPVSPSSNGVSSGSHTDRDPMSASVNGISDLPVFPLPTDGNAGGSNGLAIDPALSALTPPPITTIESTLPVPIDPALASDPRPAPAQTQTPAATPTDGQLKDDTIILVPTPPPPTTPAGPESGTPSVKRGVSDVPTLASLRAHRTTAGKPPPRSMPPTTRKPRSQNQNHHTQEKLNLRAPSYRQIQPFKFSGVGWDGGVGSKGPRGLNNPQSSNQAEPISDKMIAVGYQQSTLFQCPETLLRDQLDLGVDEELGSTEIDLVEYDMDEQDDKWLINYNSHRILTEDSTISREIFEFVMTKTEKEWVSLERKMPKVQAKPHGVGLPNRRRSSGRAADDDEDDGAEDSKCAICDDGECENANAIVFCDGCNLAVHQECYGVPYIPEGQWHCRKCQQIPRQTAVCLLLPYFRVPRLHC